MDHSLYTLYTEQHALFVNPQLSLGTEFIQIIVYTDRTTHIVIAIMMFNPGQCTYLGVEKLI